MQQMKGLWSFSLTTSEPSIICSIIFRICLAMHYENLKLEKRFDRLQNPERNLRDLLIVLNFCHMNPCRIGYLDIVSVIEKTCDKHRAELVLRPSLEEIVHYDSWARQYASEVGGKTGSKTPIAA